MSEEEKLETSGKKHKYNFFNLDSDSDEDSDEIEEKIQKENDKKIQKWDWDRPENFDLYFKHSYETKKSTKTSLLLEEIDEESIKIRMSNKNNYELSNEHSHKTPYIESYEYDSSSTTSNNLVYLLMGHKSSVNRIHWCRKPENKSILLSSSMDGTMMIWNFDLYKKKSKNQFCVKLLSNIHSKSIRNAIWSKNETEIVSVSFDQSCAFTNAETGQEVNRLNHDKILTSLCSHVGDENIFLCGSKDKILAWDVRTPKVANIYKSTIGQVQDLLFINEKEFVSCGDIVSKDSAEYSIKVWDFGSTASISNQIFHEKFVCVCLKKHPFNSLFFAQTHGNYIAEFSTKAPFKMNKYKRFEANGHMTSGYSIGFDINETGSLIASGSVDGCVYLYNYNTSNLVNKVNAFNKDIVSQPCMDAKFQHKSNSSESCLLATSCWNGLIKVFDLNK